MNAPPLASRLTAFADTDRLSPLVGLALACSFVVPAYGQLSVHCTPSAGPVEVGLYYSTTCTPSGGTGPYSFLITGLPAGLTPSASPAASLTISGTPSASGPY